MPKKKRKITSSKKSSTNKTPGEDARSSSTSDVKSRTLEVEVKKELYFPTQIYFCDLPGSEKLNANLLRSIYAMRDADPDGVVRSNVRQIGSWHSATDLNRRPEFGKLAELLTGMVQQIYRNLNYLKDSEAICDNMWANVNPRHGYNRLHTHPNVLWSGVYYVQTPSNSGRIYFRDPREQAQVTTPIFNEGEDRIRELWSEVYYEPVEGRAILFPAWLAHEVEPNLTEETGDAGNRVSISFNFVQRRKRTDTPTGGSKG